MLDPFDGPLDPQRWYVGVPGEPKDGELEMPRGSWIVSRGIPDEGLECVEIAFRSKGGSLELGFHSAREPLAAPVSGPFETPHGGGEHLLVVRSRGATLDGAPLDWSVDLSGTFRLAAQGGRIDLLEVRVSPAVEAPRPPPAIEAATVFGATTPRLHREGTRRFDRATMPLWDVEVCFLLAHGPEASFEPLAADVPGAPVLGCMVTVSDGRALARLAGGHPVAQTDWGDERRNLDAQAFADYLAREYSRFELLELVQRVLNARVPDRPELEALVALATIRHAENPHAALALAETRKARAALKALRKAAGGEDPSRLSPDVLRARAGDAAGAVLGGPPPAEWPGFRVNPTQRFVTMQRAAELTR